MELRTLFENISIFGMKKWLEDKWLKYHLNDGKCCLWPTPVILKIYQSFVERWQGSK